MFTFAPLFIRAALWLCVFAPSVICSLTHTHTQTTFAHSLVVYFQMSPFKAATFSFKTTFSFFFFFLSCFCLLFFVLRSINHYACILRSRCSKIGEKKKLKVKDKQVSAPQAKSKIALLQSNWIMKPTRTHNTHNTNERKDNKNLFFFSLSLFFTIFLSYSFQ